MVGWNGVVRRGVHGIVGTGWWLQWLVGGKVMEGVCGDLGLQGGRRVGSVRR